MSIPPGAPQAVYDHLASLPQQCVGDLYATIKTPGIFGTTKEYKVPVWGQVCDGRAHEGSVRNFLHNEFPNRGIGCVYLSWRAEPNNPDQNNYPRTGTIENPVPFDGNCR